MSDEKEPVRLDAPNQQLVRPDASHPSEEGSGGSQAKTKPKPAKPPAEPAKKSG